MPTKKQKPDSKAGVQAGTGPRVFDIAKPGTLPTVSATSRPVIVTNRTVMQDPMVVAAGTPSGTPTAEDGGESQTSVKVRSKLVIKPLSADTTADEAEVQPGGASAAGDSGPAGAPASVSDNAASGNAEAAKVDAPAAPKTGTGAPLTLKTAFQADSETNAAGLRQSDASPKPTEPASDLSGPVASEAAAEGEKDSSGSEKAGTFASTGAVDDAADNASPEAGKPKQSAADAEAAANAQAELDELVTNKTYFLPINAAGRRHSRHIYILSIILILLLAAAWLDIAMDAGFIHVPHVQPLTHFFRN